MYTLLLYFLLVVTPITAKENIIILNSENLHHHIEVYIYIENTNSVFLNKRHYDTYLLTCLNDGNTVQSKISMY